MSDLTEKFTALETQLSNEHTAVLAAFTDVTDALASIASLVETLSNNASLNTQLLLAAIAAQACPCDTTVPIVPQDPITTPVGATQDLCKRLQAFLDLFKFGWLLNIGASIEVSGGVSQFNITRLLKDALDGADITAGQLFAGVPSSVAASIVSAIQSAAAGSDYAAVGAAMSDLSSDDGFWSDMLSALFNAGSADGGLNAFHSLASSSLDGPLASIVNAMWYAAWPNDAYGTVPTIDTSGYSGSLCVTIEGCQTFTSVVAHYSDGADASSIEWPAGFAPQNSRPGGYSANKNVWANFNFDGWTITPDATIRWFKDYNASPIIINSGVTYTNVGATGLASINAYPSVATFHVTMCPPGV